MLNQKFGLLSRQAHAPASRHCGRPNHNYSACNKDFVLTCVALNFSKFIHVWSSLAWSSSGHAFLGGCVQNSRTHSVHLRKINEPFVPPKPNELESAMFSGAFRATLGT